MKRTVNVLYVKIMGSNGEISKIFRVSFPELLVSESEAKTMILATPNHSESSDLFRFPFYTLRYELAALEPLKRCSQAQPPFPEIFEFPVKSLGRAIFVYFNGSDFE